jgi:membrane-associated protease RseP (regulator of RpoE activity)
MTASFKNMVAVLSVFYSSLCVTQGFLMSSQQPAYSHCSGAPIESCGINVPQPFATRLSMALSYDQVVSMVASYSVSVPKPLGIVFGENPAPFFGLVVDDVSEGMNGGKAGLRVGDQLLAVNGKVVLGKDFDTVMGLLQEEQGALGLLLHRGPVRQLFTILGNQLEEGQSIEDDEDDNDDDDSKPVIMDENYESPVRVEVKPQKPLTAGDFVKAIGKLGSILTEKSSDPEENSAPSSRKKSGFFGIGGESIQLDGDEAKGYK